MPPLRGLPRTGLRAPEPSSVTSARLAQLAALPDSLVGPVATRLAASFPADNKEPAATSTWSEEVSLPRSTGATRSCTASLTSV